MTALLATEVAAETSTVETGLFWVLGGLAVSGALGVVIAAKAVYSAVFLAMTMIVLAVLYVAQDALFLGVVQVVVYTGAVMMLFLFVVMIVGVDLSESLTETVRGQRITTVLASLAFGILLIASTGSLSSHSSQEVAKMNDEDNVRGLAALIFTRYLWAFELTSALLITAAAGTMVLTYRQRAHRRKTQRELATDRFRAGGHPTTLPNPGVYARHNAVDIPAMLPDGSPSRLSVSPVLRPRVSAARRAPSSPPHLRLVAPVSPVDWIDEWEES
ncbi:NADH-quinone oxidoreductase subunit J [Mycobacterium sp. 852013-50091_SCH5140682]|uniref:NADH-quinone oxidoreductase subunit J n=1 Tax=Mycobacterium sp. 852013-50091_SCH5140682 TaxID=1834109 RepID=UPI0009EEFF58|nr:NADH-quinone oxidoreductase subunit J [Mycobacterium sp. 852013-50091_SCH5140682]